MNKWIATIGLWAMAFSLFAQSDASLSEEAGQNIPEEIREKIQTAIRPYPAGTQLAIGWLDGGRESFSGVVVHGDSLRFKDNRDSIFEIGSITKVFTSTILASLVLEGTLDLQDPIWKYLEVAPPDTPSIDLLMLSQHRSGLPRMPSNFLLAALKDMEDPNRHYDEEMLYDYLSGLKELSGQPGEQYAYSNLGAGMLGWIMAGVKGVPYSELVNRYVFSKYGMRRSQGDCGEDQPDLVRGRKPDGSVAKNWDFDVLAGAGSICSTTEDLLRFIRAHLDDLDPALPMTRNTMFEVSEKLDIGMGWHILKRPDGRRWYWHNGGTGGYTSSMALDPVRKTGIVILSNVSAFHPEMGGIDQLCFDILRSLGDGGE